MLLNVVPREHFEELVEVLFDLLFRELLLVDDVEPAFEEGGGHLQVGFFQQEVAQLKREEVIALARQFLPDLGVDEGVQSGFVRDVALREGGLEELLVQLGIGEFADLGDFEREFGLHLRQFVLFELQGRGTLRGILVELVDVLDELAVQKMQRNSLGAYARTLAAVGASARNVERADYVEQLLFERNVVGFSRYARIRIVEHAFNARASRTNVSACVTANAL